MIFGGGGFIRETIVTIYSGSIYLLYSGNMDVSQTFIKWPHSHFYIYIIFISLPCNLDMRNKDIYSHGSVKPGKWVLMYMS